MNAFLYPLFLALFIPLSLAVENLDQGVTLPDTVPVLVMALCTAISGHLLGIGLHLERHRRSFMAAGVVLLTYTPVIGGWILPEAMELPIRSLVFLTLGAAAAVAIGIATRNWRSFPGQLTNFLTVMLVILCLVQVGQITSHSATDPPPPDHMDQSAVTDRSATPDIWLIVFDAYTSPEVLARSYGADLNPFIGELRSREFFVPAAAKANYVNTVLSLAAMLNRRYLDPEVDDLPLDSSHLRPAARLIEHNRTTHELQQAGYEFVFFRSSFPPLSQNRTADRQIPDRVASEFTRYWLSRTLLSSAVYVHCWATGCRDGTRWPFQPESPEETREKIDRLIALAGEPHETPRFVLAHFLLPHGPMRYEASCETKAPIWPSDDIFAESETLRDLYRDQVHCTNKMILQLVEGILEGSRQPPAIVIQGDHGYGRFAYGRAKPLEEASADQIVDRTSVFGAYYLPTASDSVAFWDSISPVNVLKVVLASMSRSEENYLPDRTFWSRWDRPYEFEEVTSRARPTARLSGETSGAP